MAFKMPSEIQTGDEIWNISAGYVNIKILKLLVEVDDLETIAQYGTKIIDEVVDENLKAERRVEALHRLKDKLIQLVGNVSFEVKKKEDKDALNQLREDLIFLEPLLKGAYNRNQNHVTHVETLKINEEYFMICLRELQRIKEAMNEPINNANIIFRTSGEVELDDIINDIVASG